MLIWPTRYVQQDCNGIVSRFLFARMKTSVKHRAFASLFVAACRTHWSHTCVISFHSRLRPRITFDTAKTTDTRTLAATPPLLSQRRLSARMSTRLLHRTKDIRPSEHGDGSAVLLHYVSPHGEKRWDFHPESACDGQRNGRLGSTRSARLCFFTAGRLLVDLHQAYVCVL